MAKLVSRDCDETVCDMDGDRLLVGRSQRTVGVVESTRYQNRPTMSQHKAITVTEQRISSEVVRKHRFESYAFADMSVSRDYRETWGRLAVSVYTSHGNAQPCATVSLWLRYENHAAVLVELWASVDQTPMGKIPVTRGQEPLLDLSISLPPVSVLKPLLYKPPATLTNTDGR